LRQNVCLAAAASRTLRKGQLFTTVAYREEL